ncbi:hypothetical protein ACFLSJ_03390 [Verrucomicrobiota bacterium]
MRRLGVLMSLTLLLFATGCLVQSLHPFFTEDVVVEAPETHGEWRMVRQFGDDVSDKGIPPWVFGESEIKTFDEVGRPSNVEPTYFRVKERLFADWTAGELPNENKEGTPNMYWCCLVSACHSVFRVAATSNSLTLIPLNPDWLSAGGKRGRVKLSHVVVDDQHSNDRVVYTARPKEWVSFLRKYGDNTNAFDAEGAFVFTRIEGGDSSGQEVRTQPLQSAQAEK